MKHSIELSPIRFFLLILAVAEAIAGCSADAKKRQSNNAAAVEAAAIIHGRIVLQRTFNGSLEAAAEFVVSPKVSGRVERIYVDLGDPVKREQVVVELDDDEYRQRVVQAEADLAVATANRVEAQNALEIARREIERVSTLRERGIASETRLDSVRATFQAAEARLEVAGAQITRARAAVRGARIQLSYTRVAANWTAGDDQRVVAERFVDEGETVSANTALMSVVELNPIIGVIFVPERDYARLRVGQSVSLATDVYPGYRFEGQIQRIAPIFRPGSRQARVEVQIDNPEHRLKPGLFILATIELERAENATIVPRAALTERANATGIFLIDAEDKRVFWREVKVGIRDGERVQILGQGLSGRVVTLGQQLLDNGSSVFIPADRSSR
ncbi:MAG: efflux RND transporter periplasmic adaptor subunit [Deltaproteobacteria bacterium]|nr:efflux RND transporter periplasmic adaptor subunit [Deltaproteobacteria bacterium]